MKKYRKHTIEWNPFALKRDIYSPLLKVSFIASVKQC